MATDRMHRSTAIRTTVATANPRLLKRSERSIVYTQHGSIRPAISSRTQATPINMIIWGAILNRYRQVYRIYIWQELWIMTDGKGLEMFEKRHMTGILLFLRRMGGSATRMEIYNCVANNDHMPDKFQVLEDAGLLTQSQDRFTRAVTLTLTERGEEAAEMLESVCRLIGHGDR